MFRFTSRTAMSCCCGETSWLFSFHRRFQPIETNRTNSRSQSIRNNNKKKQHKNQKWRGNLKNGFKWPTGHIIRSKWDSLYKQAFWDMEKERTRFAHSSVREKRPCVCVQVGHMCRVELDRSPPQASTCTTWAWCCNQGKVSEREERNKSRAK